MRFTIFLTFCLVGVAFGFIDKLLTPDSLVTRRPRIVGGRDTDISEVPWQVALRYCSPETGKCGQFCGGSIINADTILTAAHCISGDKAEQISIRAGSSLRSTGGQVVQARKLIIHPKYIRKELYNDIAIIKLNGRLVFGQNVRPIALPPRGHVISAGTKLLVSGWGDLIYDGDSPEQLQSVQVPYVPNDVCAKIYRNILPNKICAGIVGLDACQGDSGGPLVHGKYVVGVVSGGDFCAYEGYPGTYTRVSEFLDFINAAN